MSVADSNSTSSMGEESWVSYFCNIKGNHVLCEVDRSFIEDPFNLFGLKNILTKDFNKALNTILDRTEVDTENDIETNNAAALLYGLIHARFIITNAGLIAMQKKYLNGAFGECPRVYCQKQAVLPVGLSDDPTLGAYSVFCPKCRELYSCPTNQRRKYRHVDGACFGTGFAHIFLMTFDDLVPCIPTATYVPRVFGFKIHASSNSLPKKVIVLDLNSQSDADSSNQLASSGENEETERGVGVQVVFDLTAEQQPQPSLLSTKVVGNPRLSLQGPPAHLNDANNGNTTVSAVSTVSHHHSSNHHHNSNHPPSNSGSAVHILPPPPRQQEYPPEAYYDALARHNGNNGNGSFHAHPAAPSADDLQQEPSKRARTQL